MESNYRRQTMIRFTYKGQECFRQYGVQAFGEEGRTMFNTIQEVDDYLKGCFENGDWAYHIEFCAVNCIDEQNPEAKVVEAVSYVVVRNYYEWQRFRGKA